MGIKLKRHFLNLISWLRRKIGELGLFGVLFLIYAGLPDYDGRNHWWIQAWAHLRPLLIADSRFVMIAIGLGLIWWDHRRLIGRLQKRDIDPNSLRYRASDLQMRIIEYRKTMPEPEHKATTPEELQEELVKSIQWSEKLTCGFELRFKDELNRLFLQCGELGLLPGFGWLLPEHIHGTDKINQIVDDLGHLVKITEEKQI